MSGRRVLILALASLLLTACGADQSSGSTAATTTASTTTTTTTAPDTAAAACPELGRSGASLDVRGDLRSSRDSRIAEAARAYDEADDPFDGSVDGAVFRALDELIHACQAAGYLAR
jgi:hypothetical protein